MDFHASSSDVRDGFYQFAISELASWFGVQESISRQMLGLEGFILGCKVARSRDVKRIEETHIGHSLLTADLWRQNSFRKLAK